MVTSLPHCVSAISPSVAFVAVSHLPAMSVPFLGSNPSVSHEFVRSLAIASPLLFQKSPQLVPTAPALSAAFTQTADLIVPAEAAKSGLSVAVISAIVVGGCVLVAVAVMVGVLWRRRSRRAIPDDSTDDALTRDLEFVPDSTDTTEGATYVDTLTYEGSAFDHPTSGFRSPLAGSLIDPSLLEGRDF
jgi:hypothetical protein